MYKLNFYPEFFERRAAAKRVVLGMALASIALGLAGLLLGIQLISAHLLDERVQNLSDSIPRLSAGLMEESESPAEVRVAKALMERRARRVDWAPKLAALSERISPSLKLLSIEAHLADRTSPTTLNLSGIIRRESDQLESVSGFVKALQEDSRINGDLSSVRLGNLKEGSNSQFLVVCESPIEKKK